MDTWNHQSESLNDYLSGKKNDLPPGFDSGEIPAPSGRGEIYFGKAPLDVSIVDVLRKRFIAFDVETTGFSSYSDRIVEVGAVFFENGKPTIRLSSLVNPGIPIPAKASAVNHITNRMLSSAPREEVFYPRLVRLLGDALQGETIICAHNAIFDVKFLCSALSRMGFDARIQYLDTLAMSKLLVPGLENYKQGTLEKYFGLVNAASHRAASDAENCGLILCRMLGI